jgi:hypothetical protein
LQYARGAFALLRRLARFVDADDQPCGAAPRLLSRNVEHMIIGTNCASGADVRLRAAGNFVGRLPRAEFTTGRGRGLTLSEKMTRHRLHPLPQVVWQSVQGDREVDGDMEVTRRALDVDN